MTDNHSPLATARRDLLERARWPRPTLWQRLRPFVWPVWAPCTRVRGRCCQRVRRFTKVTWYGGYRLRMCRQTRPSNSETQP